MTREELSEKAQELVMTNNLVCELATGTGKTKIALDCLDKVCSPGDNILILVPRTALIKEWEKEIVKWKKKIKPVIQCYNSLVMTQTKTVNGKKEISLKKPYLKLKNTEWKCVILDEAHHLSTPKQVALSTLKKDRVIALSATIKPDMMRYFKYKYDARFLKISTQQAISSNILPDPEIWLVPLNVDNVKIDQFIEVNKNANNPVITDSIRNRHIYRSNGKHAKLTCTALQKLNYINGLIDWMKSNGLEKQYLHKCGERLNFLARLKDDTVKKILKKLDKYRYIVMCNSIDQTNAMGIHCLHSKNKDTQKTLDDFNAMKINHLSSCHIINEGANLVNCKYAVFANINASKTIQIQRLGRGLRHPKPVIIIPFYKNTREEEIVNQWMREYNPVLIKRMTADLC